jgi:hypothetical protein
VGFDDVGKNVGTFDVGDEVGHVKLVPHIGNSC